MQTLYDRFPFIDSNWIGVSCRLVRWWSSSFRHGIHDTTHDFLNLLSVWGFKRKTLVVRHFVAGEALLEVLTPHFFFPSTFIMYCHHSFQALNDFVAVVLYPFLPSFFCSFLERETLFQFISLNFHTLIVTHSLRRQKVRFWLSQFVSIYLVQMHISHLILI